MRTRYNAPKNEDEFELLCLKLLRRLWNCPELQQYGKRGDRQQGVDLVDMTGRDPLRAAQCKLHEGHKSISPSEIDGEIAKAKGFRPALGYYAILTTAKVSARSDRRVLEINQQHRQQGLFAVELLNWDRIQQLLDDYSDVREEIYGVMDSSQVARVEKRLTQIEAAVTGPITVQPIDAYHSEIDEAKLAIERREFPLAKLLLQRLRQQHWDVLTPRQRFRVVTNLGAAWLGEGDPQRAAACFLEAKLYQPEDVVALTNEVLAYYMTGRLAEGFVIASDLRAKFPYHALLHSLWVNCALPEAPFSELLAGVPQTLRVDAEVAVALSLRALREGNFEWAEGTLRAVTTGKTEWSTLPGLLAKTIVGRELFGSLSDPAKSSQRMLRMREAEELFSRAINLSRNEVQGMATPGFLIDRAQVRAILENRGGWAADVEEAHRLAPNDPAVLALMGEVVRFRGDLERSIEILRGALQMSDRFDVRYHLASTLYGRGSATDYRDALELLRPLTHDGKLPRFLRVQVVGTALDCFLKQQKLSEGQAFLGEFSAEELTPLTFLAFSARLEFESGNREKADQHTRDALALVDLDTDVAALEYLARLLNRLGRYKESLPLWQRLVVPGQPGPDPRLLLDTALRLRRHDVILETCEGFRRAGVENRDLLDYEINVLEEYDVDAAIRTLQEHLRKHPDDSPALLQLSLLGLNTGDKELVCSDPARMPQVAKVTAEVGRAAVHVLKLGGRPNEALGYAYELLRLNFSESAAHRAFQFVLLPFGPVPAIQEPKQVGPDTAVIYVEDGTDEYQTKVIEQPPKDGPSFGDEISPDSSLARELEGKREGDAFVLAKGHISQRTARVKKIVNKYVYRYQDSLSEWQVRFPEDSTMESIQLTKDAAGQPDLSVLLASIDRRYEAAKKLEEAYASQPLPIHMFSSALGKNAFVGIRVLANRAGLPVMCCAGTLEEKTAAFDALRVSSEVVLDLSAIGTMSVLALADSLKDLGLQLVVSQATLGELNDMLMEAELGTSKEGYLTRVGDGYALLETTPEGKQKGIDDLRSLVNTLKSVAKILPCPELLQLDPERRDLLDRVFGRYGLEAILLAASPGRVLWTDDLWLTILAAKEYGVRRVWTQAVLEFCTTEGRLTPEAYSDSSAGLLGFEYAFTSSTPNILVSAGRIANWDIDARPLREALNQFGAPLVSGNALLQLAALFAVMLYREPIEPERRDLVFTKVLDRLFARLGSKPPIELLHGALQRLFGVNALGAEQASSCIQRWLQGSLIFPGG